MVAQGEEVVVVQGKGGSVENWLGVPGLPSLSLVAKYSCLLCWTPREKTTVEDEIKEKEEAIRQRSSEVQVRSRCVFVCEFVCSGRRERKIYGQTESLVCSCRYLGEILLLCSLVFVISASHTTIIIVFPAACLFNNNPDQTKQTQRARRC